MSYTLARQGVYRSIQGEGSMLGVPMAFIRLAGCSIGCPQCDTDYRVDQRRKTESIAKEAANLGTRWAWITGGEPSDRDLTPLVNELHFHRLKVAIATAGIRPLAVGADCISVSPHQPGTPRCLGHELKLVPGLNGLKLSDCRPDDYGDFPFRFVQPCDGIGGLDECRAWVDRNPGWRLGVQAHKLWGMA